MIFDVWKICLATNRSLDSLSLLQGFSQRSIDCRNEWGLTVRRIIDSWFFGFGSPAVDGFLENFTKDRNGAPVDKSMHNNILEQINDLARLSSSCPLPDVRSACRCILQDLQFIKKLNIFIPSPKSPSFDLSFHDMPFLKCLDSIPTEDAELYTLYVLFQEYWFQWGRLDNFIQILGYHPEFLEYFMKVHDHLFHGDLPLPYPDRYYIAILASAELRCPHLVSLFSRFFVVARGPLGWLDSLSQGPSKWLQLLALNHDLAHQPWNVTADDIQNLTRSEPSSGPAANACKETISLSELMHAVAIMTHVHSIACFAFGVGLRPEIDLVSSPSSLEVADSPSDSPLSTQISPNQSLKGAKNGIANGSEKHSVVGATERPVVDTLLSLLQEEQTDFPDQPQGDIVVGTFPTLIMENAELSLKKEFAHTFATTNSFSDHPVVKPFLSDPSSGYSDFMGTPFLASEFSWHEDASILVDRLALDLGSMLDDEFYSAYELTYNTLNSYFNVDTKRYRHSVWYFVQSLFGVLHDDFHSELIPKFLSKKQRIFLKTCATQPSDLCFLGPGALRRVFPALWPGEFVHLLLVLLSARQQACLLYALHAISEFRGRKS